MSFDEEENVQKALRAAVSAMQYSDYPTALRYALEAVGSLKQ